MLNYLPPNHSLEISQPFVVRVSLTTPSSCDLSVLRRLYINAGDVLTHLQRHNEALENYRRALDLFPISPASRGKVRSTTPNS